MPPPAARPAAPRHAEPRGSDPRIELPRPGPPNVLRVAEALRQALATGRFRSGERIREIPLAIQAGMSRGPIREALRRLEYDGLIEIHPYRGAVVPAVSALDVLEVYALRAALGSLALQKLMLVYDETIDARLSRAMASFEAAVARGDAERAAEADLLLQTAIVDSAELPRLSHDFDRLTWQVRMFIAILDVSYDDKLTVMLEEAHGLLRAIGSRDARAAETTWRAKLERWVRDFVERIPDARFDTRLWLALTSGSGAHGSPEPAVSGGEATDSLVGVPPACSTL